MLRVALILLLIAATTFGTLAASPSGRFEGRLAQLQRRGSCADLPRYGISTHRGRISDETNIALVSDVGAQIVRFDIFWEQLEKDGAYDFAPFDHLVEGLRKRNKTVLLVLAYGHPDHADGRSDSGIPLPPRTKDQRDAYYRYVQAVATRYHGPDIAYQIWNEPNIKLFWSPPPTAESYAELLTGAVRAIREIDGQATIVAAGLANESDRDDYLGKMIAAATLDRLDALAFHPYRADGPENSLLDIAEFEAVATRGRAPRSLWLTEWGYGHWWLERDYAPDQIRQRLAILTARLMLTAAIAQAKAAIFYDLVDDAASASQQEPNFGLYDYEFHAKEAALAFRTLADLTSKCDSYEFTFDANRKTIIGSFTNRTATTFVIWTYATARAQDLCIDTGSGKVSALRDIFGRNILFDSCGANSNVKLSISERAGPLILSTTH